MPAMAEHDHEVPDEGAVLERPVGQVEAAVHWEASSAILTVWLGVRLCTPAVTTRVPEVSPSRTRTEDPSRAAIVTSRVDTVRVAGSTTQTIVLPSRSSRAETGSSMPGAACVVTVAVIVVPRRKLSGGLSRVIRTRRVRVAGSACGAISRTDPAARTEGSSLQGDVEAGSRPEIPPDALGQVDHRLADIRASHRDDRLSRLDHLPELRRGGGDDTVEVGAKLGVAELLLGLVEVRPGARDAGLRGLAGLLGGVVLRLGGDVLLEQRALAGLGRGGILEAGGRAGQVGLRRPHRQLVGERVERGQALPLPDDVAHIDVTADDAPEHPKAEVGLVPGLDGSGETHGPRRLRGDEQR